MKKGHVKLMPEKIIIAIPALNEAAHIASVISTVLKDVPAEYDYQLVVADGGSADNTIEIVKGLAQSNPRIHFMHNERRNQSAAVNLIVKTFGAGTKYIIRVDAHAAYPDHFVRRLIESQRKTLADSIVIPMDSVGKGCFQRALGWLSDTPLGNGGSAHRGGRKSGWIDHGHHALFLTSRFIEVGGYDEPFTPVEDSEFDSRQRAAGAKIYMDADIRITYFPRASLKLLWRQYSRVGFARAMVTIRHPNALRARQVIVPTTVLVCLLSFALVPVAPYLLILPLAYFLIVVLGAIYLTFRHSSICGMLAAPAAVTMHFAFGIGFWVSLVRNFNHMKTIQEYSRLPLI
jgi:succinoglycan biosynthesis protein ExoA